MQLVADDLLLSASDLINFLGCTHASYLDLRQLTDPVDVPNPDEAAALIQAKGIEHERSYLAALRAAGKDVVEIAGDGLSVVDRARLTRQAMRSGVDVIYQGALTAGGWIGYADFLERVDEPSDLAPWGYEAVDTKLSRRAKPSHVIQLATYSRLIGIELGRVPAMMHVLLGTNERVPLRVAEFIHYHAIAQVRIADFTANPPTHSTAEPCGHCAICRWLGHCEAEWEAADHLSLVANITRNQRNRLNEAGVSTVRRLAGLPEGTRVEHLRPEILTKVRGQAALQIAKRDTGADRFELLPTLSAKGFARLPLASPGDIFFDMEGDPFADGGNLEYLFGFVTADQGQPKFTAFWGHDRAAEKEAFEQAIDFIMARLTRHPEAFVYHYGFYEEGALKRLAMIYGTREAEVDALLRGRKLVDLYKVVREAMRISEPRYSIKNLEVFYAGERAGEVTSALDSVVVYDRWRKSGDETLLDQIAAYNEADCRSLLMCRDWLLSLRPPEISWFEPGRTTEADGRTADPEKEAKRKEAEARAAALVRRLLAGASPADRPWRELAGHLIDFHWRAAKPTYWAMFNRQDMDEDELIEDADCIGGLTEDSAVQPFPVKQSVAYPFRFPAQDFKLRLGDRPPLIAESLEPAGEIVELDEDECRISLKRGKKRGPLPPAFSLIPAGPLDDRVLRAAIMRYAEAVADGDEDRYAAITGILRRDLPRFSAPAAVASTAADLGRAIDAIGRLDRSHLLVQGPPGAGKTHCASHAIIEMLAAGKRVGVSSNSHKAINNLLEEVEKIATERRLAFRGVKKSSTEDQYLKGRIIENTTDNGYAAAGGHQLIAGTAWLFARPELDQAIDHLFVDEAGQVSLANTVAMGVSAQNIVLVGDQMQLAQPVQGTHPGRSGMSALEHLLDDAETVPPERGIFLSTTRRMHPDLCRFVSEAFYDGRLMAEPGNERQHLVLDGHADPALAETGLRFVAVEHESCSQKSEPEAARVRELYDSLLGQGWVDREGKEHSIGIGDILVVSPYNMQVNLLASCLPAGARVGTVDKFQGQEAAVVLISMATSSGEDLPRQIEFLFSRNRLNVAISRARCFAAIVASPRLLETPCSTVEQMRLVNTLCWAKNFGDGLA